MSGHAEEAMHVPVLLAEVMAILDAGPAEICVDATVGTGGHAQALLGKLGPQGRLIGVDRDMEMLQAAAQRFDQDKRVDLSHDTYDHIYQVLRRTGQLRADVILADLGLSSAQIESPDRGFSFREDGPLDMRMDRSQEATAAQIVATAGAEELARIFFEYGQERHSRRIARAIVRARDRQPVRTTAQLADIVSHAVPGRGRIHPATRVFQALRITVNRELEILEAFLRRTPDCLEKGGRLAVIAFHSLEDRMVKQAFRQRRDSGSFDLITPKVVRASREEQLANRRSRSARLRAIRRIA